MKIRIERGTAKRIIVSQDTLKLKNSSAKIWVVKNGYQSELYASLAKGDELILGPYINIVEFDIEITGEATIQDAGIDFLDPMFLANGFISGIKTIPAGQVSVQVAHPLLKTSSKIYAQLYTLDLSLMHTPRTVRSNGSFQLEAAIAPTADVEIGWFAIP